MRLLYYFVDLFIDTFGITHPTPEARRQAAFFILGLLVLAVAGAAAAFFIISGIIR